MPEDKKQYIGPRLVESIKEEEFKTNGGNPTITVTFDGGHKEFMPKKSFDLMVTETPSDFTQLRDAKLGTIIKEILAVVAEHDMQGDDIESLSNLLTNELMNSFNKATHILWKGESNSFNPGGNAVLEQNLLDADKIIRETPDDTKSETKNNE